MKVRLLKSCLREVSRFKKVSGRVMKCVRYCYCCLHEEANIPNDVPRGHLVVYVGHDCKRFVIKVSVLNHPLFKALLDHAEDVFGFTDSASDKFHIPCSERVFLNILHNVAFVQDQKLLHFFPCMCLA